MIFRREAYFPQRHVVVSIETAAAAATGIIVGSLPATYGFATLASITALVVIVANPILGLAGLAAVIPLTPSGDGLSRLPVTPADGLALVILATFAASRSIRRRLLLRTTPAFWPGVGFIVAVLVSASASSDLSASAKEVLRWTEALVVLVVVATLCHRERDRHLVVVSVLLAVIAEALLGWGQFILRVGPDGFRVGSFLRAYGTFGQPNPFGGYLLMTVPLALAIAFWLRPSVMGSRASGATVALLLWWLALVATGVGVIALLMSLSRGALVGLALACVVLVSLYTRWGIALVVFAGVGVAVLSMLGSANILPSVVADRLTQIWAFVGPFDASRVAPTPENWAIVERMAHWQAAWNMFRSSPIVGIGPGRYASAYAEFRVNDFWIDPLGHAHNLYLNIMAETGLIGITGYLIQLVAWLAIAVASFRRSQSRFDRALAAGVVASLAGVALHNVFDNLSVHGLETEAAMLVGLCAAIGRGRDDRPGEVA